MLLYLDKVPRAPFAYHTTAAVYVYMKLLNEMKNLLQIGRQRQRRANLNLFIWLSSKKCQIMWCKLFAFCTKAGFSLLRCERARAGRQRQASLSVSIKNTDLITDD
jgi:hypothetical protein